MLPRIFRSFLLITTAVLLPAVVRGDWEPTEIVGLAYPELARQARITGVVVVRATVDSEGSVTEAVAVSGHPLLAEAARRNAQQWKFRESGQGKTAAREVFLVYYFALDGTCTRKDCRETFWVEYPNFVVVRSQMASLNVSEGKSQ